MRRILSSLFTIGPLLFGLGFVAPVTAALLHSFGITLPYSLNTLYAGLAVGLIWGLIATKRGSWL